MFFASIPEAIALRGAGKEGGDDFKKRMLQVLSQVFGIRAIPQIATALAEPWANKSFFTGRKIVPDRQEHLEPGLQANPSTSKVAQVVGEAANVSPAMIDNVVRNVFGTIGVHVETVADLLLEQTGAFPPGASAPGSPGRRSRPSCATRTTRTRSSSATSTRRWRSTAPR
jgi:hypothetical protein